MSWLIIYISITIVVMTVDKKAIVKLFAGVWLAIALATLGWLAIQVIQFDESKGSDMGVGVAEIFYGFPAAIVAVSALVLLIVKNDVLRLLALLLIGLVTLSINTAVICCLFRRGGLCHLLRAYSQDQSASLATSYLCYNRIHEVFRQAPGKNSSCSYSWFFTRWRRNYYYVYLYTR